MVVVFDIHLPSLFGDTGLQLKLSFNHFIEVGKHSKCLGLQTKREDPCISAIIIDKGNVEFVAFK